MVILGNNKNKAETPRGATPKRIRITENFALVLLHVFRRFQPRHLGKRIGIEVQELQRIQTASEGDDRIFNFIWD